jgi:integrase
MRGNITRRGKSSWRLKFDLGRDPATGERITRLVTVRGKRQDAEKELTRLLTASDAGTLVEPSAMTVAEYLHAWLDGPTGLSGKTLERYRQLADQQIIPHLGSLPLQKLRPANVEAWHAVLIKRGGKAGRALSARTVGHAHRILHRALERAVKAEIVSRNVAHAISPPKVEASEVQALNAPQIGEVLRKLSGRRLYPIAVLALGTGMRRGELLALRWSDLDLDRCTVRIERSLEETKAGLKFKGPKTRHGRRTISLPSSVIEPLRAHRKMQLEQRVAVGLGKPDDETLVFSLPDGSPMSPDNLSRDWRDAVKSRKLPQVMFHALRHTHASALIAKRLDILTISRRLGHGSPAVTLNVYGHLFEKTDEAAAEAIDEALRSGPER